MGIFDALTTSVAGLQAQSFALQNISGNIANSQTTGYKETNTSFEDMVSAASVAQTYANGVIANSVATNSVQGTIQSTQVSTDMAINGSGYFVVAQPTGSAGQPAGIQRGERLYPGRRFPAQFGRISGQRRRLLSDGHPDRFRDRKSHRQFPTSFAVQQRLRAGASDHGDPIPGQSTKHTKFWNDCWHRFRSQSACRRSGRGSGNGHWRHVAAGRHRDAHGKRESHERNHAGVARHQFGRSDNDQRRNQRATNDLHRTGGAASSDG